MLRWGCGSCGCLIIGLIIGALAVWLTFPLWQERGLVPEKFRSDAIHISEQASRQAANFAEHLRQSYKEDTGTVQSGSSQEKK